MGWGGVGVCVSFMMSVIIKHRRLHNSRMNFRSVLIVFFLFTYTNAYSDLLMERMIFRTELGGWGVI